jgi:hypothetical protein
MAYMEKIKGNDGSIPTGGRERGAKPAPSTRVMKAIVYVMNPITYAASTTSGASASVTHTYKTIKTREMNYLSGTRFTGDGIAPCGCTTPSLLRKQPSTGNDVYVALHTQLTLI